MLTVLSTSNPAGFAADCGAHAGGSGAVDGHALGTARTRDQQPAESESYSETNAY